MNRGGKVLDFGSLRPKYVPGQRPRGRQYLNRFTERVFGEIDKGMQSPWVMVFTATLVGVASWKFAKRYIAPSRELAELRVVGSKAPLHDSHNAFWGLRPSVPVGSRAESMPDSIETDLKRPVLVETEQSETNRDREWVVLELSEFDPKLGDDIYYRSLHSVHLSPTRSSKPLSADEERQQLHDNEKAVATRQQLPAPQGSEEAFTNHIHGMVKCKGVSTQNNCVPYVGHLTDEVSRKLMLSLAPAHILRDIAKSLLPWRFTVVKEAKVQTLICGLKSGELARWLSAAFPNYEIDVIEPDGAIVGLCRKYLGFRENSTLRLFIADPIEYARKLASKEIEKRYDLVVLDSVDGRNQLTTQYGRLEFINNIRNGMSLSGVVVVNIPNRDPQYIYNIVQNWRMAFNMRTVLLVHCTTAENTIMMTFQDCADRGKLNFGGVTDVEEFRDLIHTQAQHYGNNRVAFDLATEVNRENFRILEAGKEYPIEHYLPIHHPLVIQRRGGATSGGAAAKAGSASRWSNDWFREKVGAFVPAYLKRSAQEHV